MKKRIKLLSLALSVLMLAGLLTACGQSAGDPNVPEVDKSQMEFYFEASPTYPDGRTYDITVTGNLDGTVNLAIAQMPYSSVGGTWTMVDGKGYKLYFEDGTFAYTYYDTDARRFTMDYRLDLGTVAGLTKVSFLSYRDLAFNDVYDGEGLGLLPPTFTGNGYFAGGQFHCDGTTLTCNEDGTCTFTQTEWPTLYAPRTGTWEYDEAADQYTITLEPEAIEGAPGAFKNNVCSATYADVDPDTMLPPASMWEFTAQGDEAHTPNVFVTERAEDGTYWFIGEMWCVEYIDRFMTYNPGT